MKVLKLLSTLLLIPLSFILVSSANGQISGDWPTFMRVPAHDGYNATEDVLDVPPDVAWTFTMDSSPWGTVVTSEGTAFIKSSNGTLYAIEITSGNLIWSTSTPDGGSLSIMGDRVYAGTNCNNCSIQAFDKNNGNLIWTSAPMPQGTIGITAAEGKVFYAGGNKNIGALDASTGAIIWQNSLAQNIVSFPAVSDGVVYAGNFDNILYAFDTSTGTIIWQNSTLGVTYVSSAAIDGNSLFIGVGGGRLLTVDKTTGQLIRQSAVASNSIWSSPAVAEDTVYYQSLSSILYSMDKSNGNINWTYDPPGTTNAGTSSVAVANGIVYLPTLNSVYAVDKNTGNKLWHFTTEGTVGSIVVSNNHLFIPSNNGTIYAFTTTNGLNIPFFSQNDEPWGSKEYDHAKSLGFNQAFGSSLFERWGCAVTSAAMILNYHGMIEFSNGTPIDPGSLNNWLKNNDGYAYGGKGQNAYSYIYFPTIQTLTNRLFNQEKSSVVLEYKRANLNSTPTILKEDLETNQIPAILKVKNASTSSHFVVAKGFNNDTYFINDPEWNVPDLTYFGDTYSQVDRFVPSNTNLSYIVGVVNPNVEILVSIPSGNQTGKLISSGITNEYYNIPGAFYSEQEPISNPDEEGVPEELGTGVNEFLLGQPSEEGEYILTLSSDENTFYTLNIATFQEDGMQTVHKIEGIIGPDSMDEFIINYSKTSESSIDRVVTFERFREDLSILYALGEFKNRGIYNSLFVKLKAAENNRNDKTKKNILKALMNELDAQRGKGISEVAYEIILDNIKLLN